MCGIVGYVGRPARCRSCSWTACASSSTAATTPPGISVIADGAHRLGARGGQPCQPRAAMDGRRRRGRRAAGPATTGIGHTRWATHGRVNEANAHPHYDTDDRVHVVVNGIVENYIALKRAAGGHGRGLHLRDRRRGHRAPGRPPLRHGRAWSRPCAPRTPRSRATTRSSRCAWTSPACWSARARTAR